MAKEILCLDCMTKAKPKKYTKGSIGWEIVLWLLFLIPGIIYSIWRLTTKYTGCPKCKSPNIIPADSPRAIKILSDSNYATENSPTNQLRR